MTQSRIAARLGVSQLQVSQPQVSRVVAKTLEDLRKKLSP
jgi:DNA-directed RNA polymerase specialized sigma subunit